MKINREEVVWYTRLKRDSQLVRLIETNPNLIPPQTNQSLPPTSDGSVPKDNQSSGSGAK